MEKRTTVYLQTGSNIGDRAANLAQAAAEIRDHIGPIKARSSLYGSEAWGNTEQDDFYNQALKVETKLSPDELIKVILRIEKQMGRVREERWAPRLIDIDVLFYDQLVLSSQRLTIPHPQLQLRNFVLIPMMEIAPELLHPILQLTIEELYRQSTDPLEVYQLVEE